MDIENNISIENNQSIDLEKEQDNFFQTTLGKAINTGIDLGIRALLPDLIEDQVIELKDNLINYGLKDGISKTISDTIDLGKSAIGIITGNFENINQMQAAIKSGGLIDGMSSLIDKVLDKIEDKGIINDTVSSIIKQGKNAILSNIESNIEKTFASQINGIENLNNYMSSWKENFEKQDFQAMEEDFSKIEKELSNLAPLESSLSQARTIENIHTLIKNNGQNFNLSETEMSLLEKL